jgi:hypothetical protein
VWYETVRGLLTVLQPEHDFDYFGGCDKQEDYGGLLLGLP